LEGGGGFVKSILSVEMEVSAESLYPNISKLFTPMSWQYFKITY